MKEQSSQRGDSGRNPRSETYLRRESCPCCGDALSSAVPEVRSRPTAESLPFNALGPFLSSYGSERAFFTYHRCGDCGALYCPAYLTQEMLDRLYARQPENMAEAPLNARRRTQEPYFSILRRHSRLAGSYLELGADIGLFAELCARHGNFDHSWIYEPNEMVHAALSNRLGGRPHTIRAADFSARDIPAQSISSAVMIQVLDHLLDPLRTLKDIHAVLEPGGVLIVATHDTRSLLARMLGRRWPPYTLQHPHLFSPESLRRLFERAGFEMLEVVKTPNYFPATYLARAAFLVLGMSARFIPNWERPLVSLRLGNIAAVARKR